MIADRLELISAAGVRIAAAHGAGPAREELLPPPRSRRRDDE